MSTDARSSPRELSIDCRFFVRTGILAASNPTTSTGLMTADPRLTQVLPEHELLFRQGEKFMLDAFELLNEARSEAFVLQEIVGEVRLLEVTTLSEYETHCSLRDIRACARGMDATAVVVTLPGWSFKANEQLLHPRVVQLMPQLSLFRSDPSAVAFILQTLGAQYGAQWSVDPGEGGQTRLKRGLCFRGRYLAPFDNLLEGSEQLRSGQVIDLMAARSRRASR